MLIKREGSETVFTQNYEAIQSNTIKTDIFEGVLQVKLGVIYKDNWFKKGGLP